MRANDTIEVSVHNGDSVTPSFDECDAILDSINPSLTYSYPSYGKEVGMPKKSICTISKTMVKDKTKTLTGLNKTRLVSDKPQFVVPPVFESGIMVDNLIPLKTNGYARADLTLIRPSRMTDAEVAIFLTEFANSILLEVDLYASSTMAF